MKGSVSVGSSTLVPGSDGSQFIPNEHAQEAQWLASQELDLGFLSRVLVAVKLSAISSVFHIEWS
jgi:hypothetical protein